MHATQRSEGAMKVKAPSDSEEPLVAEETKQALLANAHKTQNMAVATKGLHIPEEEDKEEEEEKGEQKQGAIAGGQELEEEKKAGSKPPIPTKLKREPQGDGEFPASQDDQDEESKRAHRRESDARTEDNVEQVAQHIMSLLSFDASVPQDFKKKVMDQLLAIQDFLHLIVKDKVSLTAREPDERIDQSPEASSEEDAENDHGQGRQRKTSCNVAELM